MAIPPSTDAPGEHGPEDPRPGPDRQDHEFAVKARTQGELVRLRFFRHKGALGGMAVLVFIVVLSMTSIGAGPVPGWWDKGYTELYPVQNGGRPTLSILPTWLGGEGFRIGEHPLGQDNIGKDYFALVMRGAQQSLKIAFTVGFVATFIGTLVGALAGYYRSWLESGLMRFTDVVITIPTLVIAAVVGRTFSDSGIFVLGLVLGAVIWTGLARLVRGEFLSLREREFVEAARAMGAPGSRIIVRHILPNTIGTIIVNATLVTAAAILLETALSFLGFGVQPPETSLGLLISIYQNAFLTRPWLFWWPGLCIIAIALSINFIGDGLRDAFDPRQNRVRD
jgi:ABC-type dipeptide/oligopeptide/nickel transport system permease subunit